MFWGLIMEPNKRYSQTVEKAFHVSMATLDITTADDQIVQVMVCYEGRNYLLCNLKKGSHWQMQLDLNFQEGTKIAFTSNGSGYVHLTGYLIPEEMEDFEDEEYEDEEEEDEIPQLVKKTEKRKAQASPIETKQSSKKLKSVKAAESSDDEDDDDDDEDVEDNSLEVEAEDSDVEDEEDDQVEDEDEEEEDSDEEEAEPVVPQKKNKQQQQQQQQQKNQKAQKQQNNLTNGKEAKSKQQNKEQKSPNQSQTEQQVPKKRVVAGGVQIEEVKLGNGAPAKPGKFVSVYYVGKLVNGKKFDSSMNGNGFKFRLGKGEVIKGWDVGVQGMKVGGKRRLTIPAGMAYGAKGSPPVIPGNSTLIFDVELKNVH